MADAHLNRKSINFTNSKNFIKMKAKKAIVLSLAALAAQAAMNDIRKEYGKDTIDMNPRHAITVADDDLCYTWNPYQGECA